MGNYCSKPAKIRKFHLARNILLGLTYSLLIAYMFLFMNFALYEYPLAHCQLRQSKCFLPYAQHNGLVVNSLKFFVAKKSVPNVEKLTLTILPASDSVNYSLSSICTAAQSGPRGNNYNDDSSEFHAFMPFIATNSMAFGCST